MGNAMTDQKPESIGDRLEKLATRKRTRREALKMTAILGVAVALVTTMAPTEAKAQSSV